MASGVNYFGMNSKIVHVKFNIDININLYGLVGFKCCDYILHMRVQ